MTKTGHFSRISRSVGFVVLGAILVSAGGYYLARNMVETTMRDQAILTATDWGHFLLGRLDDFEAIADGAAPSERSLRLLEVSEDVGGVFGYNVYDPVGRMVLSSGPTGAREAADASGYSPKAALVNHFDNPFVAVEAGDGLRFPHHYAKAYVPLHREGRPVGTVEVYVDQTPARAVMMASLRNTAYKIAGALGLAFLIPAFGFLFRSRQQERTLEQLHHAANHDELTAAMNRSSFTEQVDRLIAEGEAVSIHCLDLDRFKAVNDAHGLAIGDDLLREVAHRLERLCGPGNFTGRLSGDEFAVCQVRRDGDCPQEFATMIVETLSAPYDMAGRMVRVGCSVGYVESTQHEGTASELQNCADVALYEAKTTGKGKAVGYQPYMENERQWRMAMEDRIRTAVEEELFELNYQPLFNTCDTTLRGFEALLRLRDADGKPISPASFVPVAEEVGLICEIGDWVLRHAASSAAAWPGDLTVAVNLSAYQFKTGKLVSTVEEVLAETGLPSNRLELEVTESLLITDTDSVIDQLRDLRRLGVRIALDDFGTGYSSLSYLWQFPFDKLKIDRSFMTDIENPQSKCREILKTVVSLGKVLNLCVTAEGVETEAHLEALRELSCEQSQGFLLGRPMPKEDLPAFLLRAAMASHGTHRQPDRDLARTAQAGAGA